jgi:CheY-like chemotaxis protein
MPQPQEAYPALDEPYPTSDPVPAEPALPSPSLLLVTPTPNLLTPGARPKILLVDDNQDELLLMRRLLEEQDFDVVSANSVITAIGQIAAQKFDVLLTDLHMPEAGDGFAVATVMRHTQPNVLTLVASDFPDVRKAMDTILLQADEVVTKPFDVLRITGMMEKTRRARRSPAKTIKENAASILDRDVAILMQRWLRRVEQVRELAVLALAPQERTANLPEIVRSIPSRLRDVREIEAIDRLSPAAVALGKLRYCQGYTAPLILQESRLLQVSIFETIQRNLATVDFTTVLPDIMIIADEVDSQFKQTIASFLTMKGRASAAGAVFA